MLLRREYVRRHAMSRMLNVGQRGYDAKLGTGATGGQMENVTGIRAYLRAILLLVPPNR